MSASIEQALSMFPDLVLSLKQYHPAECLPCQVTCALLGSIRKFWLRFFGLTSSRSRSSVVVEGVRSGSAIAFLDID